jgi:uncharacterized protein YciI
MWFFQHVVRGSSANRADDFICSLRLDYGRVVAQSNAQKVQSVDRFWAFQAFGFISIKEITMPKFVAIVTFQNNEQRLQVRPKHREYLASLLDQGKLVLSGPFADDTGALMMYEASSEDEVRSLISADPYTAADAIGDLQLREWRQVFPTETTS